MRAHAGSNPATNSAIDLHRRIGIIDVLCETL
jgi:hypothetical protein